MTESDAADAPVELRCPGCAHILAQTDGQVIESRHRGRTWRTTGPLWVGCEQCGAWLAVPAPAPGGQVLKCG